MSEMKQQQIGGHYACFGHKLCDRPYKFTTFGYCIRRWVHLLLEKKGKPFDHWKEHAVSSYCYCHRLLSLRDFHGRNHPKPSSFFFLRTPDDHNG